MSEKCYKGKILYNPSGKAGEYARWAANMFVGCSNNCSYCYCKKGVLSAAMGGVEPKLKAFEYFGGNPYTAIEKLHKEIESHKLQIIADGGVFFSFSTDPCLRETLAYHAPAMMQAMKLGVPVSILTKCTDWVFKSHRGQSLLELGKETGLLAVGFTLTWCDDMEPGASSNLDRARAMHVIKEMGIKTFASIEPVIDLYKSAKAIGAVSSCCDLYRIGLVSGMKRDYTVDDVKQFVADTTKFLESWPPGKVYWKESVREFVGAEFIAPYLASKKSVEASYNIFIDK